MTNDTDRRYFILSPIEHAVYELPARISHISAERWLTAAQKADALPWDAVLFHGTEHAARDAMSGLMAAFRNDNDNDNDN